MLRKSTSTQKLAATAQQLLKRNGIVTREAIATEKLAGGFSAIYPIFKAMEEAGKIRRGYFIEGRGAAQFSTAGALDRLRSLRPLPEPLRLTILAATDPANPYGATLPWPARNDHFIAGRTAGARVILINGELAAYLGKGQHSLYTYFPSSNANILIDGIARALAEIVESGKRRALYLTEIDGLPPANSPLSEALQKEGFIAYSGGYQKRSHIT
jgi:ATP-dependent Lhr-like helicase